MKRSTTGHFRNYHYHSMVTSHKAQILVSCRQVVALWTESQSERSELRIIRSKFHNNDTWFDFLSELWKSLIAVYLLHSMLKYAYRTPPAGSLSHSTPVGSETFYPQICPEASDHNIRLITNQTQITQKLDTSPWANMSLNEMTHWSTNKSLL